MFPFYTRGFFGLKPPATPNQESVFLTVDRRAISVEDSLSIPFPTLNRKYAELGIFRTHYVPEIGSSGYLPIFAEYEIFETLPRPVPGARGRSLGPMEGIGGHSMVFEPDKLPKHLREEAPNATGAGPHHEFW